MAHTKATGGAKRNVDVAGKRLGIKKFAGEYVRSGNIILRQRGTKFHPGLNTMLGKDHTIFAVAEGYVDFRQMTGYKRNQKWVDVNPKAGEEKKAVKAVAAKKDESTAKKSKPATKKSATKKATKAKAAKPAKK